MESMFANLEIAGAGTGTFYEYQRPRTSRPARQFLPRVVTALWSADEAYVPDPTGVVGADTLDQVQRLLAAQVRTMDLDSAFFEDYGKSLQRGSRSAFESFMRYNDVSHPMLGAEPSGVLEATWANGEECLTIRFNDSRKLAFALAYRDDGGQLRRRWGPSTLVTFFSDCPEAKRLARN